MYIIYICSTCMHTYVRGVFYCTDTFRVEQMSITCGHKEYNNYRVVKIRPLRTNTEQNKTMYNTYT